MQLQSQDSILAISLFHLPHPLDLPPGASLDLVGGDCSVPGFPPSVGAVE